MLSHRVRPARFGFLPRRSGPGFSLARDLLSRFRRSRSALEPFEPGRRIKNRDHLAVIAVF